MFRNPALQRLLSLTWGEQDHLHAEAVADFAKLGYHILCEKPMATTIADCVKMIRDVNESPTPAVFGIGHGTT